MSHDAPHIGAAGDQHAYTRIGEFGPLAGLGSGRRGDRRRRGGRHPSQPRLHPPSDRETGAAPRRLRDEAGGHARQFQRIGPGGADGLRVHRIAMRRLHRQHAPGDADHRSVRQGADERSALLDLGGGGRRQVPLQLEPVSRSEAERAGQRQRPARGQGREGRRAGRKAQAHQVEAAGRRDVPGPARARNPGSGDEGALHLRRRSLRGIGEGREGLFNHRLHRQGHAAWG